MQKQSNQTKPTLDRDLTLYTKNTSKRTKMTYRDQNVKL